jgi:signal peptidase I
MTDTVSRLDGGAPVPVAAPVAPTRSRRGHGPDYRLRGLDLGTHGANEAPVRPPRADLPHRRRRRRVLIGWIAVLALGALVVVLLRTSVLEPYVVRSTAMAPALRIGDRIEVVKPRLLAGPINRGSIVVFHDAAAGACVAPGVDRTEDLVLRVIGMPGQTIWSVGDTIYINGRRLNERGWYDPRFGQVGSKAIPRTKIAHGTYFLMGDNRSQRCDSRSFGTVPVSSIVGKAVTIVLRGGHPHIQFL